jgi:hypothetical protein
MYIQRISKYIIFVRYNEKGRKYYITNRQGN